MAKSVTVKVNAKQVATLKGKALQQPLYLRKLPKRAFTVTVTVTLTTGKGLTERRRYTPCRSVPSQKFAGAYRRVSPRPEPAPRYTLESPAGPATRSGPLCARELVTRNASPRRG